MNNNILNELDQCLKNQGMSKKNHRFVLEDNWYNYQNISKEIENDYAQLLDSFCTVNFGKDYRVHDDYNTCVSELNQIKNKHKLKALKWAQAECLKFQKNKE